MPNRKQARPSGRTVTRGERELLEGAAAELYEHVVSVGSIGGDDRRIADDAPERPSFDLLIQLGLLNHDSKNGVYLPVDPSLISSQVVAPLGQQGADLIAESSAWARAFNGLSLTWRRSPPGTKQGPFTEIHGRDRINQVLETKINDMHTELLTAQPQVSRSLVGVEQAAARDLRALERGVSMRTLYQHAARRNSNTYAYVNAVTAAGGEVRTLDEFFKKLMVIDRELAFIPSRDSIEVALVVREPSMVDYLVDIFERAWERGRPFVNREPGTVRDIAVEQREMTVRMLKEGHADPSAAKRLGVSPRTYAGYVSDLKHEYEAETRFQLGYAMGQRDTAEKGPAEPPT